MSIQKSAKLFFLMSALLPVCSFAVSEPLLETIAPGEPQDTSLMFLPKTVVFNQVASGGTDATAVSQISFRYHTSTDCTDTSLGSFVTPNGTSFGISLNTPFGLTAPAAWNVGANSLGIPDMTVVNSILLVLYSTNNTVPQADFSGNSYLCVPVTCSSGQCTSNLGTQNIKLKTTAAVGDPAEGGVIGCMGGGLNNFVVPTSNSTSLYWSPTNDVTSATSNTDGNFNTSRIIMFYSSPDSAAGRCSLFKTIPDPFGWVLPARDQLACMNSNAGAINLTNGNYWSSTEVDVNTAYSITVPSGSQNVTNKSTVDQIRCILNYV
jgi:hypothetical protein